MQFYIYYIVKSGYLKKLFLPDLIHNFFFGLYKWIFSGYIKQYFWLK